MGQFRPAKSTIQGLIGRQCVFCNEVFLVKSAGVKIDHECPGFMFHELELDIQFDDETEEAPRDL